MNLSTKLSALFLMILLIGICAIGYLGYRATAAMLEKSVREQLETNAFHTMDKIHRMFRERYADMVMLAEDPIISSRRSTPGRITERLKALQGDSGHYASLAFFNLKRVRLADTSGNNIGMTHPFAEYWPDIAAGKEFAIVIAESHTLKKVDIYFAAIVKDSLGRPFGVVSARMPVEQVYEIAEDTYRLHKEGETLKVELWDRNGLILYSSYEPRKMLKEKSSDWEYLKEPLSRGAVTGSVRHDYPGEDEISAFSRERRYGDFEGHGWVLVLCAPADAAFAPVRKLGRTLFLIFIVIGFALMPVVFLVSRGVLRPLKKLSRAAAEIGKGNLDVAVEPGSRDEIGELAHAFNQMARDLKESEGKYKDLAELLPQIVYEIDAQGKVAFANRYGLKLFGYSPDDLEKGLNAFQLFAPEARRKVGEAIQKGLRGEQIESVEYTALRKDGTTFPFLTFAAPLMSENRVVGLRGIGIDITERKQAEQEIRALNVELERKIAERTKQLLDAQETLVRKEKLAILGQLSGSVGHELRNPLAVISNAVFFLKTVLKGADEKVGEYLNIIMSEVETSLRIISDLLDFSRSRTALVQSVPLAGMISKSLAACSIPGNVKVVVDLPETLPPVTVDPLQMQQVFLNLIMNGVQAMPKGGSLRVVARQVQSTKFKVQGLNEVNSEPGTLNTELDAELIEISVTDTGEGISPEHREKLFQPLFTTKAKGIGLGLAVSKRNVEANGGRIEVKSEAGKGTTFSLYLPVTS